MKPKKPKKRKAKPGKVQKKKLHSAGSSDEDDNAYMGSASAVDLDVEAAKRAAEEALQNERAAEAAAAVAKAEEGANGETTAGPSEHPDPYLLRDAEYIQKDTRWRNKQRTLVFCSRGVTSQYRHLCDDVRKLLPHHKAEPKFEKRSSFHEINEICELKSCNNVIFFEGRKTSKRKDLYMWLARVPSGPTMKFQVLNIHTTLEVRLAGNCLLGSRPILYFDKHFSEISFLKLMRQLIMQAVGTPRNHPKSKPFHDHVIAFYWLDHKIWFRHYQVLPDTPDDGNDPEKQALTEIGPRFVLDPIRVLAGSFCGQMLYANAFYVSPTMLRVYARRMQQSPYVRKLEAKADRKKRLKEAEMPEDPLDDVFK